MIAALAHARASVAGHSFCYTPLFLAKKKTVEIALEHSPDIKDKFLNLFKRDEILTLGLNERQSTEEVKALIAAKPEIAETVEKKLESNPDLLKELLEIIKAQAGKESSGITINAKNIAAAMPEAIESPKANFYLQILK